MGSQLILLAPMSNLVNFSRLGGQSEPVKTQIRMELPIDEMMALISESKERVSAFVTIDASFSARTDDHHPSEPELEPELEPVEPRLIPFDVIKARLNIDATLSFKSHGDSTLDSIRIADYVSSDKALISVNDNVSVFKLDTVKRDMFKTKLMQKLGASSSFVGRVMFLLENLYISENLAASVRATDGESFVKLAQIYRVCHRNEESEFDASFEKEWEKLKGIQSSVFVKSIEEAFDLNVVPAVISFLTQSQLGDINRANRPERDWKEISDEVTIMSHKDNKTVRAAFTRQYATSLIEKIFASYKAANRRWGPFAILFSHRQQHLLALLESESFLTGYKEMHPEASVEDIEVVEKTLSKFAEMVKSINAETEKEIEEVLMLEKSNKCARFYEQFQLMIDSENVFHECSRPHSAALDKKMIDRESTYVNRLYITLDALFTNNIAELKMLDVDEKVNELFFDHAEADETVRF
eukprot:GDKJ01004945.1.p1 GENE.GDKJ01004945.1~~GDKJ01004945.1.p1  ORF type:complete len:470 (+),score=134.63 GDKJ01004945.1:1-1410(+)